MAKEKKKSSLKFYFVLIVVSALIVGGGYYLSKMNDIVSNNVSGNDQWNNIDGGSFEELPIGYSIDVPEKVNENLERSQEESSQGYIEQKFPFNYDFNDLFYGNLRPKDFSVFANKVWIPRIDIFKPNMDYYNEFVELYLNYSQIINDKPWLIDREKINSSLRETVHSYNLKNINEDLSSDTVIDYIRELDKYDLTNSNDFYLFVKNNYQMLVFNVFDSFVNLSQYSSTLDYESNSFPEYFNGANELGDTYKFTPNLSKIIKTGDNEITIEYLSEKAITKSNISNLICLNEYFEFNTFIDNSKIIYASIKEKDIPNGNVVTFRLGGYPTNQISNGYNIFYWYPNSEGIAIINTYFSEMTEAIESGIKFNPIETMETISLSCNYEYDEVLNCIMSYLYLNTMV